MKKYWNMCEFDNLIYCLDNVSNACVSDINTCRLAFKDYRDDKISDSEAKTIIEKYRAMYNVTDEQMEVADMECMDISIGGLKGGWVYLYDWG